jgi:hypothetical protein
MRSKTHVSNLNTIHTYLFISVRSTRHTHWLYRPIQHKVPMVPIAIV